MPGASLVKGLRQFDGNPDQLVRLVMLGFFALIMTYFGVTSFLRARRISRSS
jgi:hypothetical protein